MNRIKSITNPLMWFMALLLAAFVAGCGGGNGTQASQASSAKAITAFSLAAASGVPASTGTVITAEGATPKTIAVTMPSGTAVTALVATFTTTGSSVKVGTKAQVSGTTQNNFTLPLVYTVTAADGTMADYTVTVTFDAAGATAAVNLLTAGDFVILAKTAVTYGGPAGIPAVTGDVGISPGFAAAIKGFGGYAVDATNDYATASEVVAAPLIANTGRIYAPDFTGTSGVAPTTPAKMTAAQNDMVTAYNDAAGRTAGVGATNLNLGAGTLTTRTLAPGTYTWVTPGTSGGNVNITGDITLSGTATDVWIFQVSGTLTQATATSIVLGGTAKAKNIFWQVAGGVTLNGTAHMEGVILSATAITLNAGSTANSRLLAQSAVTLSGTVTQPVP